MSSEVSGFLAADWSLRPWSWPLIGWWSWHLGTAGGPETRPKLWRTYSFLATPFHSRILSRPVEMQKLKLQRMRDTKWFWKYKVFLWKDKNCIKCVRIPPDVQTWRMAWNVSSIHQSHTSFCFGTELRIATIQSIWASAARSHCQALNLCVPGEG